jgi:hypothetical protein
MTQDEFEKLRARLEEQLRLDVEMLYEAHRVKLRAFDTIRQARAELEGSERPPVSSTERRPPPAFTPLAAPPAPPVKTRGEAWSVLAGVHTALGKLPEEFDKYDLVRALGQEPSKATLARALDTLCKEKIIAISKQGTGRTPARFRKLKRTAAPEPRDAVEAEPEAGGDSQNAGSDSGNATEPV